VWSYFIHDTLTGARRAPVTPSAGSFGTMISDIGGGSHTFQVRSSDMNAADWKSLTYPWANTLVQCWDGVPVYAGLLLGRTLNRNTGTLTVQHKELRLLLNRRFPFRVGGERIIAGTLALRDKSLRGLIVEIVRSGVSKLNGDDGWNLPVALPAPEGGNFDATLYAYDFVTIENGIAEVEGRDGGPDVVFEPRLIEGRLDWLLRVGGPRLDGRTLTYPMNVPEPRLFDVQVTDDGSEMLTGVFAIGKGSEADMRVGEAGFRGNPVARIPYLDSSRSLKEIDDVRELESHGVGELAAHGQPTTQWEMKTRADVAPGLAQLRLGSILRMRYQDDWWEPDGDIDQYLIGISGGVTNTITLDVQPLRSL